MRTLCMHGTVRPPSYLAWLSAVLEAMHGQVRDQELRDKIQGKMVSEVLATGAPNEGEESFVTVPW